MSFLGSMLTGDRLADVETLLNMQYVPSKLKDQGTKVNA